MAGKTNFWAFLITPWKPKHTLRLGLYILVGTSLIIAPGLLINYLVSGQLPPFILWWTLLPVAMSAFFMLVCGIVGPFVKNLEKKMPEGALLRSHCKVVHGIIESAGIVQITSDQLIIQPLVGRQISVPLGEIIDITEHRSYNGQPYLGNTIFFKLKVPDTISDKWRLGFGVDDAETWRNLLYAQNRPAT
jgi:hypothetical protein